MKKEIISLLNNKANLSAEAKKALIDTVSYLDSGIPLIEKRKNVVARYNFDWDDNVMFMKTNIWFFHKNEDKALENGLPLEIPVSTETFRHIRKKVGKEDAFVFYNVEGDIKEVLESTKNAVKVNLKDYCMLDPNKDKSLKCGRDSFREFGVGSNENYFVKDLKYSLENKLFGPCWEDFVNCLSCGEHAKKMTIITARGHSPEEMFEGLKLLKKMKLIKHLPNVENIYPVSYRGPGSEFVASADSTSDAKKKVLEKIINHAHEEALKCPQEAPREVGFSDDDHGTIEDIKQHLEPLFDSQRWPKVHCVLYFTGNKEKEEIILNKVA